MAGGLGGRRDGRRARATSVTTLTGFPGGASASADGVGSGMRRSNTGAPI
jgi:hypothetical protein